MSRVTTTDVRQSLRSIDSLTAANDYDVPRLNMNEDEQDSDSDATFLPENNGVTGLEPNTNPIDWLTNHRRMPPHRPPVAHPQWVAIGGPLPMRIFLWDMFMGCQLLQVGIRRAIM